MRKLLVLSAVAMLAAVATGCNCCDLGCFRRPVTAAMPVCPPVAAPAATIVDPGCGQPVYGGQPVFSGQPVYGAPTVLPGAGG
jgi:hypothetical protein